MRSESWLLLPGRNKVGAKALPSDLADDSNIRRSHEGDKLLVQAGLRAFPVPEDNGNAGQRKSFCGRTREFLGIHSKHFLALY